MAYFHIVDFVESDIEGVQLAIVPELWLLSKNGSTRTTYWCCWPPDSVSTQTQNAWAMVGWRPGKDWPRYKVRIIRSYASYEKAEQMSKRYKLTSEQDMTDDEAPYNHKRRKVAPRRWRTDPDSSDSDWTPQSPSQPPSSPPPPSPFHRSSRSPAIRATTSPSPQYPSPASDSCCRRTSADHNYQQQPSPATLHYRCRTTTDVSHQYPSPASHHYNHKTPSKKSCKQPSPASQRQYRLSILPPPPPPPSPKKSHGQNSSPSSANAGSDESVLPWMETLMAKMDELQKGQEELKRGQDEIRALLQSWGTASEAVAAAAAVTATATEKPQMPEGFSFPLSSTQALKDLDSFLSSDKDAQSSMEQRLAAMGGRDVVRLTANIMGSLMVNPLARLYNYQGTKGKMAFSAHHFLMTTIREGVRRLFPETTDVTIHQAVSKWLTGSRDRDHGRRERDMARLLARRDMLQRGEKMN